MKSRVPGTVGVAVLGVGMRLPRELTDLDALWSFILSGDRAPLDPTPERSVDFQGNPTPPIAFLDDVAGFDAGFFRLTPREATAMDPQHRLLLECAYTALAHAGLTPERLQDRRTGVYVGLSFDDYAGQAEADDGLAQLNGYRALAAGRLSYHLNLTGPSIQLDTTCASTLTAVGQACRALASGDVHTALVGGVNLILSDRSTRGLRALGVLSPDGRVKAFDAAADGYGRGEGCVVLVLQRLADARARHRPLLGVIHAWADGHGGAAAGLTAPNPVTQKRLWAETLARAGLMPEDIGYVEAHGTGTVLGDAVEAEALHQVLADGRPLPIGTIKAQIGHLEAAAGGAALVKALLVAGHRRIPPLAGFAQISPHLAATPHLECPRRPADWPRDRGPYVAVHGLGISGSAACLIVGPPPREPRRKKHAGLQAEPLCLSARSPETLHALLAACIETLSQGETVPLAAFARTAHVDRGHHPWRVAVCARRPQEAAEALRLAPLPTAPSPDRRDDLLFCFEGTPAIQGRGKDLADAFPAARKFLARCDRLAPTDLPIKPSQYLHGTPNAHPAVGRVAHVAYHLLSARTARALGLQPEALQGFGLGMIAAAHDAGVLNLRACLAFAADPTRVPRCRPPARALLDPDGHDVVDQVHDPAWWRRVLAHPGGPPTDGYGTVLLLGEAGMHPRQETVPDLLIVPFMPQKAPFLPVEALTRLYRAGHDVSWDAWYDHRAVPYAPWPIYPFQHTPYRQQAAPTLEPVQADYYQALHALQTRSGNPRGCADRNLSFAPLPSRPSGFSWFRFFTDPAMPEGVAGIGMRAQEAVRALLFDDLPWPRITSVLDFGCGTGLDVVRLARAYPHVRVDAVNIDAAQSRLARDTVAAAHLADRVTVHCMDSAHAPLPHTYQLAYGYQVAGHVPDKPALFANLAAALAPGGRLVLADFFAHTGFTIDHEATAAWLAPLHLPAQWCAQNGLRLERVISAGAQVAHFLDDPDLETQLATLPSGSPVAAMFRSFAGLHGLLVKDLAGFYLITARKCPGDHVAHNSRLMRRAQPYPRALALHSALRQVADGHGTPPALTAGAVQRLNRMARGMAAQIPADLEVPPASRPYLQRLRHIAAEGPGAADPRAEARTLHRDEPSLSEECDLLLRVADQLPDVLQGRQSALDLLFPGGDTETAFRFYRHSRSGAPAHALLGRVLTAALTALPADIPRRLLEVGAGTGAAADVLRPSLPVDWAYWFTDVGPAFVARAAQAHGPDPRHVFACYDVAAPPPPDWPVDGFGVVAAANVLHATHALPDTLNHLHDLTAPGGVLLLLEGRPGCTWAEVALGGLPGWWAFQGDGLRDHPLLPAETWAHLLRDAGFDLMRSWDPDPDGPLPQTVILAVRLPSTEEAPADTAPAPAWSDADLRREIAAQTAEVLGCRPADLHADRGFLEQGGDSLTALELRERLQRSLGISLPATLLLDHPRPADLFRFLRPLLLGTTGPDAVPREPRQLRPISHTHTAIAVVGAACRFPGGANHPDAFWSLLCSGRDVVVPCPPHRRTTPAAHLPEEGGYLADPLGFDAAYFGINASEAAAMDPRQGPLLEVVVQAYEDAGLVRGIEPADGAGLYVALAGGHAAPGPDPAGDSYSATGSAAAAAAGRMAHFLGSHGPTMVVDTACSSALHAVHLACAGLRLEECPVAIAAAASLLHVPVVQPALPALGILSPRRRCHVFDAAADGIARGEGFGAVVLQPEAAARAQGRRILALIAGSAVNHDGTSAGLTAPTGPAQTALLQAALKRADLQIDQIAYVEAHGTGTPLGDAVELGALHAVFAGRTRPLHIGSVKGQLGHLETAAGMAGLLKALLVLQHGYLPPQVNLDTLSPHIDPAGILQPVRRGCPLPAGETPPVVGVSAFGFTGSNAHVLLRGIAREPLPRAPIRARHLLPLSAPDPAGLRRLARACRPYLADLTPDRLPHVCFTAALGRAHGACRMVLLGTRPADLAAALAAALAGEGHPGLVTPATRPAHPEDDASAHARAYVAGEAVDWQAVYPPAAHRMQVLPPYPFHRPVPPAVAPTVAPSAPEPTGTTPPTAHDGEAVARLLRGAVGDLLMIPPDRVDLTACLDDLGADSLVLLSLRTRLNNALGTTLTTRALFETYNRLSDLHAYLCARPAADQLEPDPTPAPNPGPALFRPAPVPVAEDPLTHRQAAHLAALIETYCRHTAGSKARAAAAARLVADRRNRLGYRRALREMQYPLHVTQASGCRITDVDGHRYIDLTMGFGTHYFGHNPAFIKEAVTARIEAGFCLGPRHDEVAEVARLTAALAGADRVAFCTTGTEAVMTAVRLARAYRGQTRIAYFRHAYHGHFDAVLGYSDAPEQGARPMYPGVADEDALILDYGTRAALDVLTLAAPHLAAVLVEPVQTAQPDLAPRAFLHALRALTEAADVPLIFDEIVTGLRSPGGTAAAHFGVRPDLVCLGKALGGGWPLSVVAGRAALMDGVDGGARRFGEDDPPATTATFCGGTFSKNPPAMAAALAVLRRLDTEGDVIRQTVIARAERFARTLNAWCAAEGVPLHVAQFAGFFRLEHPGSLDLIYYHLALEGVYIWEGRRCFLSTAHDDAALDAVITAIKRVISRLREAGFLPPAATYRRLPLTPHQRQLCYLIEAHPQAVTAHQDLLCLRLPGRIDAVRLEDALHAVTARHGLLRSRFLPGEETRRVDAAVPIRLTVVDGARVPAGWRDRVARVRAVTPLHLHRAPCFSLHLLRTTDTHYLLLCTHQLAVDGASAWILLRELSAHYLGAPLPPPGDMPPPVTGPERQAPPLPPAPRISRRETVPGAGAAARYALPLPEALQKAVRVCAGALRCRPTHLHLAAFACLLYRLSGSSRFTIGVPVSLRTPGRDDHLVGPCLTLLPVPCDLNGQASFGALARHMGRVLADALDTTRPGMAAPVAPHGEAAAPSPLQVVFNAEDARGLGRLFNLPCTVVPTPIAGQLPLFSFHITHLDQGDLICVDYATRAFDATEVARITAYFLHLLQAAVTDPSRHPHRLPLAPPEPVSPPSLPTTPPCLFVCLARQVATNGQAPAWGRHGRMVSYTAFWACIQALAHTFRKLGIGPETPVGLPAHAHPETLAAWWALWWVGAYPLLLDPNLPPPRREAVMRAAGCRRVFAPNLLDDPPAMERLTPLDGPLPPTPQPRQAAYAVATSGTSGTPKICVVAHGALRRYVQGAITAFGITPGLTYAVVSPLWVDLGYCQLFLATATGGRVHLFEGDATRHAETLAEAFAHQPVDVLKLTPAHLRALLAAPEGARLLPRRILIMGGEVPDPALQARIADLAPGLRCYDGYGPTEACIETLVTPLVPAGPTRPLEGTAAYLLDTQGSLIPEAVTGEIYLAGSTLARGYAGSPGRTAEVFLPDPFAQEPGARMYRTGDLAVRRGDRLEIRGRIDSALKSRGFRIDPMEVEAVLCTLPGVAQAAITMVAGRLTALLVGRARDTAGMRTEMAKRLPEAYCPQAYVWCTALPLLPSGKLDRPALPSLIPTHAPARVTPPRTAAEHTLAAIWAEVLRLPLAEIDIHRGFFHLGGDSLTAMDAVGRARSAGLSHRLADLVATPTIAALAARSSNDLIPEADTYDLLPMQARFLAHTPPARRHLCQMVLLLNLRPDTCLKRLEAAVDQLVARHPALRLRFDPDPHPTAHMRQCLPVVDLTGAPARLTAHAAAVQARIDLPTGRLCRVVVYRRHGRPDCLLLRVHHLVADAVSLRILLQDLSAFYVDPSPMGMSGSWGAYARRVRTLGPPPQNKPETTGPTLLQETRLTQAETTRVHAALGPHFEAGLLQAFVGACAQGKTAEVDLETHGRRAEADLPDVVGVPGWFTAFVPLTLSLPEDMRAEARPALQAALTAAAARAHEATERAPLCFNYLGDFDPVLGQAPLAGLAPEDPGPDHDPEAAPEHLLALHAWQHGGSLWLRLTANGAHVNPTQIQAYLQACRTRLLQTEMVTSAPSVFQTALLAGLTRQNTRGCYVNRHTQILDGPLHPTAFAAAWQAATDAHSILRTAFGHDPQGHPQLQVRDSYPCPLTLIDCRGLSAAQSVALQARLTKEPAHLPLGPRPPWRLHLLRLTPTRHLWVWDHHHLLLDGWSTAALQVAVAEAYAHLCRTHTKTPPLLPTPSDFRHYAAWEAAQPTEPHDQNVMHAYLSGFHTPTPLPYDADPHLPVPTAPHEVRHTLADLWPALTTQATRIGVTPHTLISAACALLLGEGAGTHDVVLDTVWSRRPPGMEGMMGPLISTLPLWVRWADEALGTWLRDLHQTATRIADTRQAPADLRANAGVPPGMPLCDLLLVTASYPHHDAEPHYPGLRAEAAGWIEPTDYALVVVVVPGARPTLSLQADRRKLTPAGCTRLLHRLLYFLSILSSAEDTTRITALTAPPRPLSPDGWTPAPDVVQGLAAAVQRSPEAPAMSGERTLTYAALWAHMGGMARLLRRHGVGCDDVVVLATRRRDTALIAVGACWMVGAACIAPGPGVAETFEGAAFHVTDETAYGPASPSLATVDTETAAYLIRTSGSTGHPKCVVLGRGVLAALAAGMHARLPAPSGRCLQFAHPAFDVFYQELLWTWLGGGCLHVPPPTVHHDPIALLETLTHAHIDHAFLPTAVLRHLAAAPADGAPAPRGLRTLITAGEALVLSPAIRALCRACPDLTLHNHYGPAETHVVTTAATGARDLPDTAQMPIGRPLPGTAVYLLDASLHPVADGAPGVLYVAGAQIGRGYAHRRAATATSFLPDPYARRPGARMYRTGDVARRMPDGNLMYLGRGDGACKIQGRRVDPLEIEAALLEDGAVHAAAVVPVAVQGDWVLHAHVAMDPVDPTRLRRWVAARLPAFMHPRVWHVAETLPRTAGGKVDRARLVSVPARRASAPPVWVDARITAGFAKVLGTEGLDADADFFALGGHSLHAARLAFLLTREGFGHVSPHLVFQHPTPAALQRALRDTPMALPAPEHTALSFSQERLYVVHRHGAGEAFYHLTTTWRLDGVFSAALLEQAAAHVQARHALLDTVYETCDGIPSRRRGAHRPAMQEVALSHPSAGHIATLLEAARHKRFNLQEGPVWRLLMLRTAPDTCILMCTVHHIAADAVSIDLLVGDLARAYAAAASGTPKPIPPDNGAFDRFVALQRAQAAEADADRAAAIWADAPHPVTLPADMRAPAAHGQGMALEIRLDGPTTTALRRIAEVRRTSLFTVLHAAWACFIGAVAGTQKLAVAFARDGRDREDWTSCFGCFTETCAVLHTWTDDTRFADRVTALHAATREAVDPRMPPFQVLGRLTHPPRDPLQAPLCTTAITWVDAPPPVPVFPGAATTAHPSPTGTTRYDVELFVRQAADGLVLETLYRADRFQETNMRRLCDGFHDVLAWVGRAPDTPIARLHLPTPAAFRRLLYALADGTAIPAFGHVPEPMRSAPDTAPALITPELHTSYGTLRRQITVLTAALHTRGIGPEDRVAVATAHTADHLAASFAVWRCGATLVALDPHQPAAYRDGLIAAIRPKAVLDDKTLAAWVAHPLPAHPPLPTPSPQNLAYLSFTSGSSGTPKAVGTPYGALHGYLWDLVRTWDLGPDDTTALLSVRGFDAHLRETVAPLTVGACLVDGDRPRTQPRDLLRFYAAMGTRCLLAATPTTLRDLAAAVQDAPALPDVRLVLASGEAMDGETVRAVATLCGPHATLVNLYGPTEATLTTSAARVSLRRPSLHLGTPRAGRRLYLLACGLPVPPGAVGTLFVAGPGLARGYEGRPGATAAVFVPDPGSEEPGARCYDTGDLARLDGDSRLQFVGRRDRMVKLRGSRVEPAEIERVLRDLPGITEAVVVPTRAGNGDQALAAFVVAIDGTWDDTEEATRHTRAHLAAHLPAYMMPATLVFEQTLPRLANGKPDTRTLRARAAGSRQAPDPPCPETAAMAALWTEVLNVPVGAQDDFFALGGHSMTALRLAALIETRLDARMHPALLFAHPTPARLVSALAAVAPADTASRQAHAVTPMQTAVLAADAGRGDAAYHLALAFAWRGPLSVACLNTALETLCAQRPDLRRTYRLLDGGATAAAAPSAPQVRVIDVSAVRAHQQALAARLIHTRFHTATQMPLRVCLLRRDGRRARLLLVAHHVAVDAAGLYTIATALIHHYAAALHGTPPPAEPPLSTRLFRPDEAALQEAVSDLRDAPTYPTDGPRHNGQGWGSLPVRVDADLAARVHALASDQQTTPFCVLLTAFAHALARLTRRAEALVATPMRWAPVSTAGPAVDLRVLRLKAAGDAARRLRLTQALVRAAQARPGVAYDALVRALNPVRVPHRMPLAGAHFSYHEPWPVLPGPHKVRLRPLPLPAVPPKYELSLVVQAGAGSFEGAISFRLPWFDAADAAETATYWLEALGQLVADALPDLPASPPPDSHPAQTPDTPSPRDLTARLQDLWTAVTGAPAAADTDFFALGGHSLSALALADAVHRETGFSVTPDMIPAYPTPAALARALNFFQKK